MKTELKTDIKRYKKDRHDIKELFDQLIAIFRSKKLMPDRFNLRKTRTSLKALKTLDWQLQAEIGVLNGSDAEILANLQN